MAEQGWDCPVSWVPESNAEVLPRGADQWLGSQCGWDLLALGPLGCSEGSLGALPSAWGCRPPCNTACSWASAAGGSRATPGTGREEAWEALLWDSSPGHTCPPPFPSLRLLWQIVWTLQHAVWTKPRPGKRDTSDLTLDLPPVLCSPG